jgi:hypothetical protein
MQHGAALIALLAVIALGSAWFLVSNLNANSAVMTATVSNRNAEVLSRAKQALIGYVALQAVKSGGNDPGALPCPEPASSFGDPANEGMAANDCTLPAVGRLPWRTLGLDKLVDTAGEPLWYVVASGWAKPSAAANTVINSNSVGQLSVDPRSVTSLTRSGAVATVSMASHGFKTGDAVVITGATQSEYNAGASITVLDANTFTYPVSSSPSSPATGTIKAGAAAVALIIAPGPAFSVPAATGCAAISQTRPTSGTPNWRNYLECENATYPTADSIFVTTGPSGSFNDQVVKVTAAEVLPGIEAAIANRIEREIVPALKSVYASNTWHSSLSAADPLMPYPAPFADPSTSNYHGAAGQGAGLLPLFQTQGCTPATDPRCTTATTGPSAFLVFSKNGNDTFQTLLPPLPLGWIRTQSTCTWSGSVYTCTGEYQLTSIRVTLTLRVTNIAMGLRTFDSSKISCTAVDDVGAGNPLQNIGCLSTSVALQADGSALVTVTTNWTPDIVTSGWGTYANYIISFDRAVFGDHALVGTTDPTTGWFARNKWHEVVYYAAAPGRMAAALPAIGCTSGSTCLSVSNVTPSGVQRAIFILAGRSINGSARPSSTLGNYLEFGNATGSFERQAISTWSNSTLKKPFNDRIIVVDSN